MPDQVDEPSVGPEHPMHRSESGLQVGDVHQAQLAHHAVNAFVVDPDEVLGIAT